VAPRQRCSSGPAKTAVPRRKWRLLQRFDQVDIRPLVGRLALHRLQSVPLRAADQIGQARALGGYIALGRLLVQQVDPQQRLIVGSLGQLLAVAIARSNCDFSMRIGVFSALDPRT
jgi:hypothetical protein